MSRQLLSGLSLKQEQSQCLSLSYVRRQMINMISMNAAELGEYVRTESARNLCIEIDYTGLSATDVIEATAMAPVDFRQDLRLQLATVRDKQLHKAACYIIQMLDNDGFLRESVSQLAKWASLDKIVMEKALRLIQSLEPPGIAARNLQECFLLQLKRKKLLNTDVWTLVHDAFDLLSKKDTRAVCELLGWSKERLLDALSELKKLSVHPAETYSDTDRHLIIPDAEIIKNEDGRYVVRLCEQAVPKARISESYLMSVGAGGSRFSNEGIYYAKRFLYCLERRNRTLLSIFQYAVDKQTGYLDGGPIKRLLMRDVAMELKLHPSTITRAISNKYVLFRNRILPISALFDSDGVDGISSGQIKEAINELIKSEEGHDPYSDQVIADMLRYDYMVNISRRAVAKYRNEMGIPSSKERKILCQESKTSTNS